MYVQLTTDEAAHLGYLMFQAAGCIRAAVDHCLTPDEVPLIDRTVHSRDEAVKSVLKTLPQAEKDRMKALLLSSVRRGLPQDVVIKLICDMYPELFTLDHILAHIPLDRVESVLRCLNIIDITAEFDAIHQMRDGAAGDGVSLADGQQHFDEEYGATEIARFIALKKQTGGLNPTAILASPKITTAFVTQAFIALKKRIQDRVNHVTKESDFRVFAATNLYRVPKMIGELQDIKELWIRFNFDLELVPLEIIQLQQLHVLNIVGNDNLAVFAPQIAACVKKVKTRQVARMMRQKQMDEALDFVLKALESGLEYWCRLSILH